jgi:K+-transporting ATPase KdpF subunit
MVGAIRLFGARWCAGDLRRSPGCYLRLVAGRNTPLGGWINGRHHISLAHPGLIRGELGVDSGARALDGGQGMNWLYLITGVITFALLIYLVLALLKPEWFG